MLTSYETTKKKLAFLIKRVKMTVNSHYFYTPRLGFNPTVDTRTTPRSDSPTSVTLHQPDN